MDSSQDRPATAVPASSMSPPPESPETANSLYFTAPREVQVRSRPCRPPDPGEVRVTAELSAVSAGTEGLIYRGEAPEDLPADRTIDALREDLSFPLRYGYATVGRVTEVGPDVDDAWLDRRVFAYNPHESRFATDPEWLVPIPTSVSSREAALFASVETAVNLVLDGDPTIGERVVVYGQGVVGLLSTALLARHPIERLAVVDRYERRRDLGRRFGADVTIDPGADPRAALGADPDADDEPAKASTHAAADLAYELSGNPDALDDAVDAVGYDGRVIVGSWYGTKEVDLDLGGRFHRDRITIESSQVSTIDPERRGRWSRERRHEVAWSILEELDTEALITHEIPFDRAPEAYELVDQQPDEAVQVLLRYG